MFLPAAVFADARFGEGELPASLEAGGLSVPEAIAVSDKEGGDLYVADGALNQRVDQFTPGGAWVRAFGFGIVPGAASGTGNLTAGSTTVTSAATTSGYFGGGFGGIRKFVTGEGIQPNTQITTVGPTELTLSKPATKTVSGVTITAAAGPGNVSANEIQKLSVAATAGEFKLSFTSPSPGTSTATTVPIPAAATSAEVEEALEGLANIGTGNVAVNGGPGSEAGDTPYTIEFKGRFADANVRALSPINLTLSGGSPSGVTITTVKEGARVLETCTAVCLGESVGEGERERETGQGAYAGQLNYGDAIAVDNSCAEQEPPLTGSACEAFDASYGDIYVVDQRNLRVEKYGPAGEFRLTFGGEVDKTTGANVCTKADLEAGDVCGAGVPGTGPSHFYDPTSSTAFFWAGEGNNSIAVGPDGTVYVGDYARVQEFNPDGNFAGQLNLPDIEPQFVGAIAVDASGNIFERSVIFESGVLTHQIQGVREYGPGPSHTFLRTFDTGAEEAGGEPTSIAVGPNGELYTAEPNGATSEPPTGDFQFRTFRPTGGLLAVFNSDQVQAGNELLDGFPINGNANGLAIGSTSLYTAGTKPGGWHVAVIPIPKPGPPRVEEQRVSDVEPETATLHALVNPKQFDTHYRFQYITDADFKADGESFGAGTEQITPAEPALGSVDRRNPVSAPLSPLTPRTLYHWRVLAESECEPVEHPGHICLTEPEATFETLPDVSVRDFTTQTVGPERVELKAELSPDNGTGTEYTLRYGEDQSYSGGSSSGQIHVLGNAFEAISATFTGLKPNTTYHYQLLFKNSYGEEETADQTFTTELSAAGERAVEDCPANGTIHGATGSTLREENNSLALPDCRAYEQVSPPYKAGYPVLLGSWLAPSGERVQFDSLGAFAGAVADAPPAPVQYIAQRQAAGWATRAAVANPAGPGYLPEIAADFSPELDRWVFPELPALSAGPVVTSGSYYEGGADGGFSKATPTISLVEGKALKYDYMMGLHASADNLSHLFIGTSARLLPGPADPRPGENHNTASIVTRIYEVAGGPDPTLTLAAEVPLGLEGAVESGCHINEVRATEPVTAPNARLSSSDGATLFYTSPVELVPDAECGEGRPNPIGLFARTGGGVPVQLNAAPVSQCHSPAPCSSSATALPYFAGASPGADRAWFATAQPLVDSDVDSTESASSQDLYLAKLEPNGQVKELVQASRGGPSDPRRGEGAGVLGVLRLSQQGNAAAFVATGVLTTEPNDNGSPHGEVAALGADNLYVYDSEAGEAKFVGRLCSGREESGTIHDPACPAGKDAADTELWIKGGVGHKAHLTPDGRYLIFTSAGRLTQDDADSVSDLYRYDFQTGQLTRLSFGHRGNDANGNDDAYPVYIPSEGPSGTSEAHELSEDFARSVSADGAVAIFKTSAPLVSRDANAGPSPGCEPLETGCDLYQWEEDGHGTCRETGGCVSLVSDGRDPHGISGGTISASGRDITFGTSRSLAPTDTDGVGDVYDARENGGFPYLPPHKICEDGETAEACGRGAGPVPTPPNISTPNFVGPGNEPTQLGCGKGRHRVKKHGQARCAPNHHKKPRHRQPGHKRANANRGGGK